jgi:3-methyladenine DNA glycosylase Tag
MYKTEFEEAVHEFDFERITNLPQDNIESWNKNQEVVGLDLFFN